MRVLELKVPPPAVAFLTAALMWLVSRASPTLSFDVPARLPFAVLIAVLGFGTSVSGVLTFRRFKTTVNPTKPGSATALVNSGVYAITRNPMYLGLLVMLTGWAIFLSNTLAFVFLPLFVLYISRFQIAPEERALTSLFGQTYVGYKDRVRRWL